MASKVAETVTAEPSVEQRIRKEERFKALTTRLKQRLKSLADDIYNDELFSVKTVNQVIDALDSLRAYKRKMDLDIDLVCEIVPVERYPSELFCPYSEKPMFHPVVIASGKTLERSTVDNWLAEGYRTCPVTGTVLPHTYATPNNLVKEMMKQYCEENDIIYPVEKISEEEDCPKQITKHDLTKLLLGFEYWSPSIYKIAKKLRYMSNKYEKFRTLFRTSDVFQLMLLPLNQLTDSTGERSNPIYEDLITTIYNLSTHPDCKRLLIQYPTPIQLLTELLTCGSIGSRLGAAGALYLLSTADKEISKKILGQAGALKPLIEVLAEGHLLTSKVAADALLSLCEDEDNKDIAIHEDIVKVILRKLRICVLVDELLALLLMLSTRKQARDEMWNENALAVIENLNKVVTTGTSIKNCLDIISLFDSHQQERIVKKEYRERERKAAENAITEQKSLQKKAISLTTKFRSMFSMNTTYSSNIR